MSIDYFSTPYKPQTRKFKTMPSWGKISSKWRDIKIPMQGKDMLSLRSDSGKIKDNRVECWNMRQGNIRPCSVRLKRYQPSPDLFWEVEKVKLKDETVLHYNGIVIQERKKANSGVKSQKKPRRDYNSKRGARLGDGQYGQVMGQQADGGKGRLSMTVFYEYIVKDPENGPKMLKCTVCGKQGSDRGNLRKHVENVHFPGTLSYECKYCTETFTTRNGLNHHFSKMHKSV